MKPALILGAAASLGAGFPLGARLRDDICALANSKQDVGSIFGPRDWARFENFLTVFRRTGYPSIDIFLEHRREFLEVGRRAIAAALLPHEREADLFPPALNEGFDSPRLCVQVKSQSSPVDVSVFRGLIGTMDAFDAEQGLLVAWGGFKDTVVREARSAFFRVRLWDAGDLLDAVFWNYDKLPEEMQAELPLKRIWALASADLEG